MRKNLIERDDDALLRDADAAKFLGISSRCLRLWRRTRGVPHYKLTGKEIRYSRADLQAWLAQHRVAISA